MVTRRRRDPSWTNSPSARRQKIYTVTGHREDGRLELVRQRDGKDVLWDLHEHGALDYGYATTSYRSQGRTVDAVFALASF